MFKELLQNISSLQKEEMELKQDQQKEKMADINTTYPQKCPHDGDMGVEDNFSKGEGNSDDHEEDIGGEDYNPLDSFKLSEEAKPS